LKILIIGAGQLGSRHLQSLIKYHSKLMIYVVDSSLASLELSQSRAAEINNDYGTEVIYFESLAAVTETSFYLTIVATGSGPRFMIFDQLIKSFNSEKFILEKFLFQEPNSYRLAADLINGQNSNVYVNCPLRTWPIFKAIKEEISDLNAPVTIHYSGGDWIGLGCNSIHYIDVLAFITESLLARVDASKIDSGILESKRPGYIEFTGTLLCEYRDGSRLEIESIRNSSIDSKIVIRCEDRVWIIDELSGNYQYQRNREVMKYDKFKLPYQSDLTHKMLSQLVDYNTCELPDFLESSSYHLMFLHEMLNKYNEINNSKSNHLPIT
jgi:hypothetical protein